MVMDEHNKNCRHWQPEVISRPDLLPTPLTDMNVDAIRVKGRSMAIEGRTQAILGNELIALMSITGGLAASISRATTHRSRG